MSLSDDIKSALQADTALVALLTGGIHNDVEEISRANTASAFDSTSKEIKPCALIKMGNEFPLFGYETSVQTPFTIYLYQRQGYDVIEAAMDKIYDDLHKSKTGTDVWEIEHDLTVYQQRDQALDCALGSLRFTAKRLR